MTFRNAPSSASLPSVGNDEPMEPRPSSPLPAPGRARGRPGRSPAQGERILSGWGRYPRVHGRETTGDSLLRLSDGAVLSGGLGRAYGDAGLPPPNAQRPLLRTTHADRLLRFDPTTAVLRAEAGVCLADLIHVFLPRGFFTPVSPGTAFVTLGGMVAADIHGKNHHVAGSFGEHVRSLRIRTGDGKIRDIGPDREPELFAATLGGMGLTGHILEVEFQLERVPSPWIVEERHMVSSVEELIPRLSEVGREWPMTVAWLDTAQRGAALGRGSLWIGRWASRDEAPARAFPGIRERIEVPFELPSGLLNPTTLGWANSVWYRAQYLKQGRSLASPQQFFYPLDAVRSWPRAYGRRGFTQYQCVLPSEPAVFRSFLELFQRMGGCSFVTVVKDCGPEGRGMLSFPKPGTSIALDIPIKPPSSTPSTQQLVDRLNAFTLDHGGRIYLAKDAFTRAEDFRAMYPRFDEWTRVRRKFDPEGKLGSAMSLRLMGDAR